MNWWMLMFFLPWRRKKRDSHNRFICSFISLHFLAAVECNYLSLSPRPQQFLPLHHSIWIWCECLLTSYTCFSIVQSVSSALAFFLLLSLSGTLRNPAQILWDFCVCRDTEDWWQLFQSIVSVFDTAPSSPSLSTLLSLSPPLPALRKVSLSYCG